MFFNPVDGDSKFLRTDDARRLVNVAVSRAKARLVVCLSKGDRKNPLFGQLAALIDKEDGAALPEGRSIEKLVGLYDFPKCCVGVTIRTRSLVGKVLRLENQGNIW